ncbi:MAG: DUF4065 domain-containing protein [Candidatus Cloacimonetes bacterium]|nr:DUF4065 domain-containing protein [Candidatus Cloacimonadota bacterium]
MIDFKTILARILKTFKENEISFGKTRLLKIAYLVELFYYRNEMKRLTGEKWVFYKFGPYLMNYDNILNDKKIFVVEDMKDDFTKISLNESATIPELSKEINLIISRTVKSYGDIDFYKLLDFVYYDTEPMIDVKERLDKLDFSSVKPQKYYDIKEFKNLDEVLEKLNLKYRERFKNAQRI